ncbi:MAG: aldehyde dehydrogenase family protein [bacterium]|nr:aldehyde dehydrogenase family protein [bacterium]
MKGLDPDLRALQEMRDAVARAKRAQAAVADYSQAQADRLCAAMAEAGAAAAADIARLAVEETGIGRVHYKVLKNLLGSEGVWDSIRDQKTVGVVSRDEARGVVEVATPVGIVAGIVPTTNPTSTAYYKCLISVKGRNAVVISPHPRAKRCIGEAVEVMRRAIERAGGPPDLCIALSNPTIESTGALMKHRDVSIILSTGGAGLVRAAYSSGKPAYGVGPGNVPAYVDRSANVERVAEDIVTSQSFDNATLCCSEQALVVDAPVLDRFLAALAARGAHLCSEEETRLLARYVNKGGHMNPDIVGIDPWRVAEAAGFRVPRSTSVLLAHQGGVGKDWPLSIEILCPLLSVHRVDGWEAGCSVSKEILHYGGLGHTLAVHADDQDVLEQFFLQKPASRIVANGPSSMGAVGFSTNLMPAMSLGCGPQAGNITSDNITATHLVNLKRVAFPRRDWKEIELAYHERAAQLIGDPAPRGSGLPGDPALGAARAASAPAPALGAAPTSNWHGNPAFAAGCARAQDPRSGTLTPAGSPAPKSLKSKVGPASKSGGNNPPGAATGARPAAPTFTRPAAPRTAPAQSAQPAKGPARAVSPAPANVGGALSLTEIQTIMDHAGAGCPMGPCKGCPHQDVRTSACSA